MKENKLGTYLTSFTDKDWESYLKFSKGLYAQTTDYHKVIDYIRRNKKRYDPSYMDTDYLRNKVRPSASKNVFANVISGLCKHIEKYFVWAEIEKDPMMEDTLLLQALGKRGLSNQFHKQKDKAKSKREKSPIGLWNEYHEFMSEYLMYYCNMTFDRKISKTVLKKALNSLNNLHSHVGGYLGVEIHNRTTLLNEDWSKTFDFDKIHDIDNNLLKNTYRHIMKMKAERDIYSFYFLNDTLKKEYFSRDLRHTILIHLTSYINGQIVRGKISDGKDILELYKYGLEKDLLFPNGLIPLLRFINIINVACDTKNYIWANDFIDAYSIQVDRNNINEVKLLGYSQIEFSKNNFEKVIELLRDVKYKILDIEARAKWFLLCSFYELNKNNIEIVENYALSLENFLRRNMSKTTKLTDASFKKSARFLLKIAKSKKIEPLIELIKTEKSLYYRKWLLSKASEKV